MGRTNATYRNHLDSIVDRFLPFRKALRSENQSYLDELWEHAHRYAHAADYMNSKNPGIPAMISIMLGVQRQLDELEERVEELECSRST